MYCGVDWAGKGWFAAIITEEGEIESAFYPTLWNLWEAKGDQIERLLIDIPIGLCADSRRACDIAAKEWLNPAQQSSVFYTPIRKAVYATNLEKAKEEQRTKSVGFGVQNQAWSLIPRIREADRFVAGCEQSDKIHETHPEVCFAALNDGAVEASKHNREGVRRRRSLLDSELKPDVKEFFETAQSTFREPLYAPMIGGQDDILDALAAAATARYPANELRSLPEDSCSDYDTELEREIEIKYPPNE